MKPLVLLGCIAVYSCLAAGSGGRLLGQQLIHAPVSSPVVKVFHDARPEGLASAGLIAADGFLGDGSRDHRYTGFWVGALTIAIPGVAYFLACGSPGEFCDRGKLAWRVPLASALTGLVGALIGAAVAK